MDTMSTALFKDLYSMDKFIEYDFCYKSDTIAPLWRLVNEHHCKLGRCHDVDEMKLYITNKNATKYVVCGAKGNQLNTHFSLDSVWDEGGATLEEVLKELGANSFANNFAKDAIENYRDVTNLSRGYGLKTTIEEVTVNSVNLCRIKIYSEISNAVIYSNLLSITGNILFSEYESIDYVGNSMWQFNRMGAHMSLRKALDEYANVASNMAFTADL